MVCAQAIKDIFVEATVNTSSATSLLVEHYHIGTNYSEYRKYSLPVAKSIRAEDVAILTKGLTALENCSAAARSEK